MTSNINDFYNYVNHNYLHKKIPDNQSSNGNFIDINNNNIDGLIDILNNMTPSSSSDHLIKELYLKYCNFINLTQEQKIHNCKLINNIIKHLDDYDSFIEKFNYLNKFGLSIFFNYEIIENPINDSKMRPYIISLDEVSVAFSKEYYHDKKYMRELNGLKEYRLELLTNLKRMLNAFQNMNLYPELYGININEMCEDIMYMEKHLSPYMLTNEKKRVLKDRVNVYKLKDLNLNLPSIGFMSNCFLDEFKINSNNGSKEDISILFSSNLSNLKTLSENKEINYSEITGELKNHLDNGDYYWLKINDMIDKYNNNDPKIRRIIDNYMKWKIINSLSLYISEEIRLIKFKFSGTFMNGQRTEKSVNVRAITYLMEIVPELLGEIYCKTFFPNENLILMKELIKYLIDTYNYNFQHKCKWILDDSTNNMTLKEALKKLNVLSDPQHQKIGYPSKEVYASKYELLFKLIEDIFGTNGIKDMSLLDFSLITAIWHNINDVNKLNRNVKQLDEWEMSPAMTNAYYNPLKNEMVFPAGILQAPFFIYISKDEIKNKGINLLNSKYGELLFDRLRLSEDNEKYKSLKYITMASNFGAIGTIIGHEISHGFDDQGSKFDSEGKFKNWWSDNVKTSYDKITNNLVKQFNEYCVVLNIDGVVETFHINGMLTLGENIADLFGLTIAIDAFKEYFKNNSINGRLSNKTLDESLLELIISYTNVWRLTEDPRRTKNKITSDVHSVPKFRVIGILKNISIYNIIDPNFSSPTQIKIFN